MQKVVVRIRLVVAPDRLDEIPHFLRIDVKVREQVELVEGENDERRILVGRAPVCVSANKRTNGIGRKKENEEGKDREKERERAMQVLECKSTRLNADFGLEMPSTDSKKKTGTVV